MQKKTKLIGNIIFMLLLLGATMYLLLKDQDLPEIRRLLRGASGSMILFAVLCAVMYLILESTSLIVILRSLGERMHFFPSLRYSFIGFLFNALTPSASGGQPMMVLYMKADGINMGASSVAMLFWTIIYKIALVIVEAIVVLFYHPFMVKTLGHYQWLFWVGMAVNVVSIVLYGIIVFSKNGARYIVRFATWLLHKVRLVKRRERLEKKLDHMLEAYEEGALYMRTHWGTAGIVLVITLAQRLVYFLVTWFIYLALGLSGSTVIEVIILQSFISVCIDILPVPGGVGANEGFSVVMFRTIMQNQYVYPAMLLSRGVILGEHGEVSRCTDDGEPSGTAGRPILEVLHGAGVHDILVIVTRYFGGTLLGTGGLVRACSQAAQAGLAASTIIDKLMGYRLEIRTDYNGIGKLQYIFGQMGLPLMDTVYAEDVVVTVAVPDSDKDSLINKVTEATAGQAQISGQEEHIYFGVRDGEMLLFD